MKKSVFVLAILIAIDIAVTLVSLTGSRGRGESIIAAQGESARAQGETNLALQTIIGNQASVLRACGWLTK